MGGLFWDPLFADRFRILQHCMFRDELPLSTVHKGDFITSRRSDSHARRRLALARMDTGATRVRQIPNQNNAISELKQVGH